MRSLFSPDIRQSDYRPVVHAYYDRADMIGTTHKETHHAHTLCEIMYVNEGRIIVEVAGRRVDVGRKQFIWMDSAVRHLLVLDDSSICSVMNIEFQFEELPAGGPPIHHLYRHMQDFREMLDHPAPFLVLTDTDDTIYNLLKQIISLADSTHHEAEALCSGLTSQVLLLMARHRRLSRKKTSSPIQNTYVSAAVQYIQKNYRESLTVQQIAAALHVHSTYLHRLFKAHMHETVGEYIEKMRMEHAQRLLRETDHSLPDIAALAGFSSRQRFAQLFRRAAGMSPSEYRIRFREPQQDR